jgi:hypothetical protein
MEQGRFTSSGTLTFTDSNNSSIYAAGQGSIPVNDLVYNSTTNVGLGILNPNQTFTINTPNKMRYTRAALFNVTRDEKTNQIIDANLVKEFWVKVKSGVTFDVAAAHANGFAPDPDKEVIRELESIHF